MCWLLSPREGGTRLGAHRGLLLVSLSCMSTEFKKATDDVKCESHSVVLLRGTSGDRSLQTHGHWPARHLLSWETLVLGSVLRAELLDPHTWEAGGALV